jgi:hypothetical protein
MLPPPERSARSRANSIWRYRMSQRDPLDKALFVQRHNLILLLTTSPALRPYGRYTAWEASTSSHVLATNYGTGWLRDTMVGQVCCLSAHRKRHPKLSGHYGGRAGSPLQGFCDLGHA